MSVAMDKRSSRSYGGYVDVFENTQSRTFLKWLNARLESANIPTMTDLATDLSDGVRLCQLMEIMSQSSLGRYNTNPRMRVQKAENVNRALQFIKGSGVILTNIGPEDIMDGNLKLVLGMIWTLILRFTIADINEEGLSAKEGLLLWCQRKTAPYEEVDVQDFSHSWKDGLAFCALLHRHRPDLLDWNKLDKSDPHACTKLAFTLAERHLNIPQLLEVADICDVARPDERSVMTYIAQYFHAFTVADRADALARRVAMFADTLDGVWSSRNDYERRAAELVHAISTLLSQWSSAVLAAAYEQAKAEAYAFAEYKKGTKRNWVGQKADLAGLLGNISTKLRTYSMKPYIPPDGLKQKDIDGQWQMLLMAEAQRSKAINANIRQIKEQLRKRYADLANACQSSLSNIEVEPATVDGPPETQLRSVADLHERISYILTATLPEVEHAERLCRAASIEENDYTVYTFEDLAFEAGLVRDNVGKKRAFLENQIVARTSTKLTPSQLEEFESTFRHFDRDQTNTLGMIEFSSALAALGIIYSDADTLAIHEQLSGSIDGRVTFQAWIDFLTDITEDQTTPDQVRESFAGIAQGKPFVTELDLKLALVPANTVNFLKNAMPAVHATNGATGHSDSDTVLDFHTFLDHTFA